MERDFRDFLEDIIQMCGQIDEFIRGIDKEQFLNDTKTVYAVIRCIEIIGEAVKHIPTDVRERYNEIPWKMWAGMRDRLIHAYWHILLPVIWETITTKTSEIKNTSIKILDELNKKYN